MNDSSVAAFDYKRECRRYSMEMFTSCRSGDTDYIFWTGPEDFVLENATGTSQPTGTPVILSNAFMGLFA